MPLSPTSLAKVYTDVNTCVKAHSSALMYDGWWHEAWGWTWCPLGATEPPSRIYLQLRLKIKSLTTNLTGLLAEADETANMFVELARRLRDAYKFARDYRKLSRLRKERQRWRGLPVRSRVPVFRKSFDTETLASAWLIADFGIAPLVGDLAEACKRLQSGAHAARVAVKAASVSTTEVAYVSRGFAATAAGYRADCEVRSKWEKREHAMVLVTFDDTKIRSFTPGNPLEWAWERLTLSFVVDYVLRVGDWLSAIDALEGVSGISGWLTTRQQILTVCTPITTTPTDRYGKVYVNGTHGSYVYKSHQRDVITDIPMPRLPEWRPSANWKRVADMSAILRGYRTAKAIA